MPIGRHSGSRHSWSLAPRHKALGSKEPAASDASSSPLVLYNREEYGEAESVCRRALREREKVLGPEHLQTLTIVQSLAIVLQAQNKLEEAKAVSRRALAGLESLLGLEHRDTLESMNCLAVTLDYLRESREAEKLFRIVSTTRKETLGAEHPDTLKSVGNLELFLENDWMRSEVEQTCRRALAALENTLRIAPHDVPKNIVDSPGAILAHDKLAETEEPSRQALIELDNIAASKQCGTTESVEIPPRLSQHQGVYQNAIGDKSSSNNMGFETTHRECDRSIHTLTESTMDSQTQDDISNLVSSTNDDWTDSAEVTASSWTHLTDSRNDSILKRPPSFSAGAEGHVFSLRDLIDIQSIASLDDDIQSTAESVAFVNIMEAGASAVVKAFTEVVGISALYEEASAQMDTGFFIENHRRLLKLFYLEACQTDDNTTSSLVVRFLRSRRARIRISARIVELLRSWHIIC